jgi:hypothetical protein
MAKYAKVKHFFGNVVRIDTQQEMRNLIRKNEILLIEKSTDKNPTLTFIHFSRIYPSLKFVHLHLVISKENMRLFPNLAEKSHRTLEIYKYGYLIYEFNDYKSYDIIHDPSASSKIIRPRPQGDMIRGDLLQNSDTICQSGLDPPGFSKGKNDRINAVIRDPLNDAIESLDDLTFRQVLYIYYFSFIINALKSMTVYLTEKCKGIPKELIFLILTVLIIKYI